MTPRIRIVWEYDRNTIRLTKLSLKWSPQITVLRGRCPITSILSATVKYCILFRVIYFSMFLLETRFYGICEELPHDVTKRREPCCTVISYKLRQKDLSITNNVATLNYYESRNKSSRIYTKIEYIKKIYKNWGRAYFCAIAPNKKILLSLEKKIQIKPHSANLKANSKIINIPFEI